MTLCDHSHQKPGLGELYYFKGATGWTFFAQRVVRRGKFNFDCSFQYNLKVVMHRFCWRPYRGFLYFVA